MVLQEMFAVCANERRMKEADALATAIAALSAAPAAEAVAVQAFAIDVEKLLCSALGREWSATGISIESLIATLQRERDELLGRAEGDDREVEHPLPRLC